MTTILLIDDHGTVRENLAEVLTLFEYKTVLVGSGKEAMGALWSHATGQVPIDLILCDLRLPDMSGIDLLRLVREKLSPNLPFIMMTADFSDQSRQQAMRLGATDYLVKPFYADLLLETIKRHI